MSDPPTLAGRPPAFTDAPGYMAALREALVIHRPDRAVLRLHGRDPVRMVQGLISNDLAGAPEGRGTYATVLTAKGRLVADVRAFRRAAGDVLLETAADAMPALRQHLKRFVPPLFARQDDLSAAWRVLGVYGPGSDSALRRVLGAAPETTQEESFIETPFADAVLLATFTLYAGIPGCDIFGPTEAVDRLRAALVEGGVATAGQDILETLRIEAGRPRWGAELDEGVIPLEAGLRQRAISETKGCYTGQEVIVRILHRGHVNRHLRGLLLGSIPPPAAGTELRNADGRVVGHLTSACVSPRLGQTIGLGYVRREVSPPAVVSLAMGAEGDVAAHVVELPFDLPDTPMSATHDAGTVSSEKTGG